MEDSGIFFFFPFKNISKFPPVSQSKRILQLSVQPPFRTRGWEFVSSLLFGGWCIFVGGRKGCRTKSTVAKLLKTRSTRSSRSRINRWTLRFTLQLFHSELSCDQLKCSNVRRTFTLMDSSSSNHQLKALSTGFVLNTTLNNDRLFGEKVGSSDWK